MEEMTNVTVTARATTKQGDGTTIICPKCGTEMMTGRYGIYCPAKCGFRLCRKVFGEPISEEQRLALLNGEEIFVEGIISRRTGRPYSVYVRANGLREYQFTDKEGQEATGWDISLDRRFPDEGPERAEGS